MGFLSDLEQQAAALAKAGGIGDRESIERNTRLANVACRTALDYWRKLAQHLNVIAPTGRGRYLFDNRHVLEQLPCVNFGAEPKRRTILSGEEHYESVTLQWTASSGQTLTIDKELPAEVERLAQRLSQAGIMAETSTIRHAETGRAAGTRFQFKANVQVHAQIVAMHAEGRVKVRLTNLESLERVEVEFPAFAIRPGLLDELSKWIVGQPHDFLKYAQNLRRFER